MSFLNGCAQNVALIAPAYTLASTGNVYQAGISYGSNQAIQKITGKTTSENVKNFIDVKKKKSQEEEYDKFYILVKNRIEKTSKILNLANQ